VTARYLLPCSCGRKIEVRRHQAGDEVRCDCGATLEVPTLLEMTALEEASPPKCSPKRPPAPWGGRQRMALIGIVIALAATALAVWLLLDWPTPPQSKFSAQRIRERTEALSPLESWQVWHLLRATGPAGRTPPDEEKEKYQQNLVRSRMWMGLIVAIAVTGVGLAIAGLWKRRPHSPQPG